MNGRTICIEFFFCLFQISASIGRAAVTEGDNLGGMGDNPSTSVLVGAIRPKTQSMYMFALLANLSIYEFLQFFITKLDELVMTNYNERGLLCRFEGFARTNTKWKRIPYRKR